MKSSKLQNLFAAAVAFSVVSASAGAASQGVGDASLVAPRSITNAIVHLGDLYRDGAISAADGQAALKYYLRRFPDAGEVFATIPPDRLITGEPVSRPPDVEAAGRNYKIAANLGNPEAFLRLGDLYLDGKLLPADPVKAFEYFRQAADLGSQTASINTAMMMIRGLGTERDVDGGLKRLLAVAELDNINALLQLGNLFLAGEPGAVPPDATGAFEFYQRAADSGNTVAALAVARMIINGEGTPPAPEKGLAIAQNLAETGNSGAQLLIGDVFFSGVPGAVPVDLPKAFAAYSAAADAGSATGLIQTGVMLVRGQGVTLDVKRGLKILNKAAESGNDRALVALGDIYDAGAEALPANPEKAYGYFSAAVDKGNVAAKLMVGRMLLVGRGTEAKQGRALKMLKALASAGRPDANLLLAEFFAGEVGGIKRPDFGKAFGYYRQAANAGSNTGQLRMALMLVSGKGVKRDVDGGLANLRAIAEKGDPDAFLAIGDLYASGEAGRVDADAAVEAYEAAAALGATSAYIRLGDLFSASSTVPADVERAINYYRKAAGLDEGPTGANLQ